jgi:hypothetical protein
LDFTFTFPQVPQPMLLQQEVVPSISMPQKSAITVLLMFRASPLESLPVAVAVFPAEENKLLCNVFFIVFVFVLNNLF